MHNDAGLNHARLPQSKLFLGCMGCVRTRPGKFPATKLLADENPWYPEEILIGTLPGISGLSLRLGRLGVWRVLLSGLCRARRQALRAVFRHLFRVVQFAIDRRL